MTGEELVRHQKNLELDQIERSRLEGAVSELIDQLSNLGCKTLDDAESKIKKGSEIQKEYEALWKAAFKKLEDCYSEKIGEAV